MVLFANSLKITVKDLPAKACDSLVNWNTPFKTHSNFYHVNEKIRNVSNSFEMHHEKIGTGEPHYHSKQQCSSKWRFIYIFIDFASVLYKTVLKQYPLEQAFFPALPREIGVLLENLNFVNSRNGILFLYIIKDCTIIVVMNRLKYTLKPQ